LTQKGPEPNWEKKEKENTQNFSKKRNTLRKFGCNARE